MSPSSIGDEAVAGNLYPKAIRSGTLPPLIPVPPVDSDWDTKIYSGGVEFLDIPQDRRHSGWEEVERRWTDAKKPARPAASEKASESSKRDREAAANFPYPHISIPSPNLKSEFRMKVTLNPQSASVAVGDGFKKWTTFSGGIWSGLFGYGVVVSGGQDSQDLVHGKTLATQVEATHRLKTGDEPPAYIECKSRGFSTGPPEVMRALQDPETSEGVDPRLCQYRVFISMKTNDDRYAEKLNFGMWIGSCLCKDLDVVYDAYRIS